jgi:uncharacterized membrane protein YbhN (UPF0104 family)
MKFFSKSNRDILFRGMGSLFALFLLFFLLSRQSWREILGAAQQVSWKNFLLGLLFLFISRFFVIGRWYVLLRFVGEKISFSETALLAFAGLFASNFLPTTIGGDVVRMGGAIQRGYGRAVSVASVLVDRLIGMTGMAMALPFAFAWWGKVSSLLSLALPIQPLLKKARLFLKKLWETLSLWMHQPLSLLFSLFFTWGHMLCVFGALWVFLHALGEPLALWQVAGLWSMTYFLTLIPISINGYGVQELSLTYFLTYFGGVSTAHGLIAALLMRAVFMIASLPGAIFLPAILTRLRRDEEIE